MLRKDPLIHFLLIGGLLFTALSLFDREPDRSEILIPAARVAELRSAAELLQGRPPTTAELDQLIRSAVREEVYYREALARGLDADDTVVRQRLIEKMQELTENVAEPVPPETDLEAWFAANRERFRIPELVSFDHVFFSPRMRGESVRTDAEQGLAALADGADPATSGDSTPLGARFEAADAERVRVLFDDELTEAVFGAEIERWIGPFESGFGWHVVRVIERSAARDPAYAEIEAVVREAYMAERLEAANAAAFDALLGQFDVRVEWQAGVGAETWP